MPPRRFILFASAPIPVGHEVLVEVFEDAGLQVVRAKDLVTSVVYGGSRGPADWSRPAAPPDARLLMSVRGHVVDCVVYNAIVSNDQGTRGYAAETTITVEELPDAAPYR